MARELPLRHPRAGDGAGARRGAGLGAARAGGLERGDCASARTGQRNAQSRWRDAAPRCARDGGVRGARARDRLRAHSSRGRRLGRDAARHAAARRARGARRGHLRRRARRRAAHGDAAGGRRLHAHHRAGGRHVAARRGAARPRRLGDAVRRAAARRADLGAVGAVGLECGGAVEPRPLAGAPAGPRHHPDRAAAARALRDHRTRDGLFRRAPRRVAQRRATAPERAARAAPQARARACRAA